MKDLSNKALLRRLFAGSLLFYLFSGVSSLLNYAFYPVIARFVTVSEYGEIQFLVSMFTQLAVGFVVLNMLAIIISARSTSLYERREAISSLNVIASIVILVIVLLGSLLLYINQSTLGIHNQLAITALGISLVVSVPFTILIGRLQGNDRFIASGVLSVLSALFKLLFSLLLIMLGFGVAGAILGIALGMIVTLVIVGIIDRQKKSSYKTGISKHLQQLTGVKEQTLIALPALTLITLLSSADSIVSRVVLDAHQAGQYAAIATLSKTIIAITSPLMWLALLPAVVKDTKKILQLIKLTAIASLFASLIFSLFSDILLKKLLGIDAGYFANLLPLASIAMTFCSLAFIIVSSVICMGRLRTVAISIFGAITFYLLVFLFLTPTVGAIQSTLYAQIVSGACIVFAGLYALKGVSR